MTDYKAVAAEEFGRLQEMIHTTDGWEELERKKLPATVDSSHVCEYGGAPVKCVRAWGVVDNDPRAILKLLWDETKEQKMKDDDTTLDHRIVEDVNDEATLQVIYQRYSLPWPIHNRDFCFLRGDMTADDGTIFLISISVEHPDVPEVPKCVRGSILNSAYVCKPREDGKTDFCYIVQMDPQGHIPKWLVNKNLYRVSQRVEQVQKKYKR